MERLANRVPDLRGQRRWLKDHVDGYWFCVGLGWTGVTIVDLFSSDYRFATLNGIVASANLAYSFIKPKLRRFYEV